MVENLRLKWAFLHQAGDSMGKVPLAVSNYYQTISSIDIKTIPAPDGWRFETTGFKAMEALLCISLPPTINLSLVVGSLQLWSGTQIFIAGKPVHRLEKIWLFHVVSKGKFWRFFFVISWRPAAGRQCDSGGLCLVGGDAELAPCMLLQIPNRRGLHCLYGSVQPMHDAHSESAALRNFSNYTSCLLNPIECFVHSAWSGSIGPPHRGGIIILNPPLSWNEQRRCPSCLA